MTRIALHRTAALTCALLLAACGGSEPEPAAEVAADEPSPLVVYSGRNEALVGPILERFAESFGMEVEVRYGGTAEMAATLLEEGENTPADVFVSQDAAALGALAREGMLRPLPAEVADRVPARFRPAGDEWVGLSGRVRSVVYNPEMISPEELPQSLEEVGEPRYRGRFGVAPANASFQAHMAAYRAVRGAEALDELLAAMVANQPRRYPKNTPIVEAVIAGEIEWGLVNHYYLWRALAEDPEAPGRNFLMPEGRVSTFVNMAGAGVLSDRPEARDLIAWLLGEEAQEYFARETFEYPLVPGIEPAVELQPLAELAGEQIDFAAVSGELEATLQAIHDSGLLSE